MATLPTIDYGSRNLAVPGNIITPETDTGASRFHREAGRAIDRSLSIASHALYRTAEVLDRRDEREAEYAVMLGTDYLKNGFQGVDSVNDKGETVHTPGIANRTWQDFRNGNTDAVKSTEELIRSVREQEFYTNLSSSQKRKFDRAFTFRESEVRRAAADLHGRLALKHKQEQDLEMVKWNGDRVAETYGADDETYAGRVRWAVSRNFGIAQGSAIKNPEILDDPNCDLTKDEWFDKLEWSGGPLSDEEKRLKRNQLVKMAVKYDLGRVDALTKAAAGNRGLGAGLLATPEGCLLKAAQITNGLNGNGFGVRPDGTKKGTGWCGVLRNANGDFVTEYSMQSDAVKVDGKRIDFPTLVPGLTAEERQLVLDKSAGKEVDAEKYAAVEQKAVDHAKKMIAEGKSVWRDSGSGAAHINDAQRNALLDTVGEAAREMRRVRDHEQSLNGKKLDAELDEKQWHFIENPMGEQFDEGGYLAQVDQAVRSGAISRAQGLTLFGRYQKMRKDRDELAEDLKNPSVFREKSDPMVWVRLKQMIADAERNNTPAAQLEVAVARAKTSLSSKEYFALWHEARQKRDAEDDRITSQVFAEFLKIDEDTVKTAIDPSKRTSKAGAEAVDALLGSPNAEYERSWRIHNPDFTVEDVDEAVRLVRDYVKANPGNSEGARQLLENLVKPHAEAARARTFRDRIQAVRRSRQWSVEKAFAQ